MVSIIVPIYNVAPYLRQCLDSILNQTYRDLEIILVDDGSTDGCAAIADEYKAQDERIRVIHQANSGLSAARNAGLRVATGEYVWFVDSDDYIALNACEILMKHMSEDKDVIVFSRQRFTASGVRNTDILEEASYETGKDYIAKHLGGPFSHTAWNKFIRRRLFTDQDLTFAPGRYEDCYFSFRLMYLARRVQVLSDILYFYRCDRVSSIVSCVNSADKDVLLTIERLEQWLEDHQDRDTDRKAFAIYVFDWIFSSIMIKYPCKILYNRSAHRISREIIRDERFNKYLRAIAQQPSAGWKRRITAWTMNHCYPLFAFVVYLLYHIKHHNT